MTAVAFTAATTRHVLVIATPCHAHARPPRLKHKKIYIHTVHPWPFLVCKLYCILCTLVSEVQFAHDESELVCTILAAVKVKANCELREGESLDVAWIFHHDSN